MSIAQGSAVKRSLAASGIAVIGIRWKWFPGRKGETYEPHLDRDNVRVFNPEGFVGEPEHGTMPYNAPNAAYCCCQTALLLRGAGGRFLPELG